MIICYCACAWTRLSSPSESSQDFKSVESNRWPQSCMILKYLIKTLIPCWDMKFHIPVQFLNYCSLQNFITYDNKPYFSQSWFQNRNTPIYILFGYFLWYLAIFVGRHSTSEINKYINRNIMGSSTTSSFESFIPISICCKFEEILLPLDFP